MAYDITPKTQPANMDYENSKNFTNLVQIAHDEAQFERTRRANQPSKYTQTLQAINSTLQTVNTGLQVAENVSKVYDQITEKSFKQEQLDKQNRLKEKIQGAINEHDWNTVTTLAMTDMQTASQMPEYMSMLGSMAKIEGNEGAAALLKSINTEQQGKLEVEEIKNLGKLQVENTKGQFSLQKQALSNQGAMQRAMYNQSQQNARFNTRMQFNQDKAVMIEEGKNIRQQNSIDSKDYKSEKPTRNNFGTAPVNNTTISSDNNATTPTVTEETNTTTTPTESTVPTESSSYINNFKNKTYNVSLANKSQNNKISELRQKGQNAINAPTKQEQVKAQENKKRTLENQQTTSELVNSYQNSELPSMMYNFKNAKGTDTGSKLNYILTNPDKYDVNIITEPKNIRTIINGTDSNLANTNLSDKYNNVIGIAQIKELSTGKTQNLYLDANQAYQFNSIANYANEKTQEIKNAMGEGDINNKLTLTSKQFSNRAKHLATQRALSDHNIRTKIVSAYGIPSDPYIVSDAIDYLVNVNPKATPQEVQNYIQTSFVRNQQDKEFNQTNINYSNRYQEYSYPPINNNPIVHQLERQRSEQLGIQDEEYLKEDSYPPINNNPIVHQLERQRSEQLGIQDEEYLKEDLRNLGIIKSETDIAREKLDDYLYDRSNQGLSKQESSMLKDLQELDIILTNEDKIAQLKKREQELIKKLGLDKLVSNEDKIAQLKKREQELIKKLGLDKLVSNEDKIAQLKKREQELLKKLGLDKIR